MPNFFLTDIISHHPPQFCIFKISIGIYKIYLDYKSVIIFRPNLEQIEQTYPSIIDTHNNTPFLLVTSILYTIFILPVSKH